MGRTKLIKSEILNNLLNDLFDSKTKDSEDKLIAKYDYKNTKQLIISILLHIDYTKSIHTYEFENNVDTKKFLQENFNSINEKTLNRIAENRYIVIVKSVNNNFKYVDFLYTPVKTKDKMDIDTTILYFDCSTNDRDTIIKLFKQIKKRLNCFEKQYLLKNNIRKEIKQIVIGLDNDCKETENALLLEKITAQEVSQIVLEAFKENQINFNKQNELEQEIEFIFSELDKNYFVDMINQIKKSEKMKELSNKDIELISKINEKNINKFICKKRFIKKIITSNINNLEPEIKVKIFALLFAYNIQMTNISQKEFQILTEYMSVALHFIEDNGNHIFKKLGIVSTFDTFMQISQSFAEVVTLELLACLKINKYQSSKGNYIKIENCEYEKQNVVISPSDIVKRNFFKTFDEKIAKILEFGFLHKLFFKKNNFNYDILFSNDTHNEVKQIKNYIKSYDFYFTNFCIMGHLYFDYYDVITSKKNLTSLLVLKEKKQLECLNINYLDFCSIKSFLDSQNNTVTQDNYLLHLNKMHFDLEKMII